MPRGGIDEIGIGLYGHGMSVRDFQCRLDVNSLARNQQPKDLEIDRFQVRTTVPPLCDPYSRNRTTGSFILIDEATSVTVGAGMINSGA